MASVNKVTLIGNLGRDPEVRSTQDGMKVCNLSVATEESWRDKSTGDRKSRTEWMRVVIFNERLVDVAEKYLRKGSKVYLEGSLQTRKWTDQAGVEKYTTEIVLQKFKGEIVLLDTKPEADEQESDRGQMSGGGGAGGGNHALDDDIPFAPSMI